MRDDGLSWRPGDLLPDSWFLPDACPDGHPWGPGRVTMSYDKTGVYHHYCVPDPTDTRMYCRWLLVEQADREPRWLDYRS